MSARFNRDLTDRFACSRKAGEMLFGASPFTVLPNGVDTGAFARHDPEARARLREHLGVAEDEILLGHVGRFSAQKNHAGLLRIFAAALQRRPNARLLLLGQGPLEAETRALAQELGVADRVIFAGVRTNVQVFYHAMDAFLLPSLFEGLPVVLVEAQAAGLPCFVSDTIDRGAAFADGVHFLPLGDTDAWAAALAGADLARNPARPGPGAGRRVRRAHKRRHPAGILPAPLAGGDAMSAAPLAAVVVPVYNAGPYLPACLRSPGGADAPGLALLPGGRRVGRRVRRAVRPGRARGCALYGAAPGAVRRFGRAGRPGCAPPRPTARPGSLSAMRTTSATPTCCAC